MVGPVVAERVKMANITASLYVNVKADDGKWKFYRPVTKQNGS